MQKYVIALYIRLSLEDYKYDSMSIENQHLALNEFVSSMPESANAEVLEFIDNGYSGTNFERPKVQELIEMVRANKIDCIIVKDFSRFGRNSIETGYFIERVFPLFHTRFISINDDFDSDQHKGDTGGMDVAFKYLISEYYSWDMSIKTKSAKYAKMQRGEYQSKVCPYGYRKSADGRMEPNPETAAVVQLIFQLAATGIGAAAVTRELFKRGIPTPGEYKAAHGQKYHDVSRSRGRWSGATVLRILEDERYIGSYVIGRRAVIEVGGTRSRRKERDKWFIIPDHHPAIVDKELFEKVQAVQRRFSLPTKKTREYPLKGKVYCGCCDHALSRIAQKKPFYMCRHSTADVNSRCRDVRADAAGLEEAVLLTLKKQLEILLPEHEDGTIHLEATAAKCSEYEKQLEALRDQKQSLFERYLLGQIELDTYKSEKAVYDAEIASLFSTATNTDEAKEEIINVLRMANSEILKKDSLIRVGHIVNDNLSTIEQDVLKQSIELGLVEPRFEAIAGALRAWIKPRWVYLRKDHSEFQLLKDSYSEEEWTKNTSEDETGVYLDILTLRQLKKDLPAAVVMLLDTLSLNSFELFQNGLGYNNILFMSTVLGDMKTSADTALFNLLLVEEPEAHLHPQLQELVHGFFDKNSNRESFQVIYTSHSPTLVSRIGIDKLVLLYEQKHRVNCLSLSQSNIDEDDRDNLERYLDVTKSQMLFAKGILFVEGISEALLLPIFAEYLNRPLDKYAVEVINVDGVSFKPFANLLCYANDTHQVTIKATIIIDDRCTNKEDKETYIVKDIDYDTDDIDSIVLKLKSTTPSERFQSIDALCQKAHVNILGARKTFEYELAAYPENIPYLLEAIIQAQPVAGKRLASVLAKLHTDEEKAACLWLYIRDRSKYKGEIAQNLARRLKRELTTMLWPRPESSDICAITKPFIVPDYIKKAVYSVTEEA